MAYIGNTLIDTRTHGQRRHAERHFEPAPRRRWNRDFRAVRRINVLPALGWIAAMAFTLYLTTPQGMAIFAAVWGTP